MTFAMIWTPRVAGFTRHRRVRRSEGEHEAGRAQQLVSGRRPDGRPVLLHQPVLHSHRGHPPSGLRPPATSGPASGAARGAAARSDACEGWPTRATQPTHQHRSGKPCVCLCVYANLTATAVTPTGNMYMDTRQNISSLMGPPGYPHMPPMSNTAPAMTGDLPPPPTSFGCQYSKCWYRSMPAVMFIVRGVRYCGAMSGTLVYSGTAAR